MACGAYVFGLVRDFQWFERSQQWHDDDISL